MRWWMLCAALVCPAKAARADDAKPDAKALHVPYRLTTTQHVLVRAKINGKGPFNFIVDTGAPVLFLANKVAEKAGLSSGRGGQVRIGRFEIEGGVVVENVTGKADDLFQLEGMNGMGLAGTELHGVIGYNVLARYRIEYDFTRDKLVWTPLGYRPPAFSGLGGKSAPAGLQAIGGMMKFLGGMMGLKANFAVQPRGFLGAEFADGEGGVRVARVLPGGPADKAGLKAGDRVRKLGDDEIDEAGEIAKKLAKSPEGAKVTLTVDRGGRERVITIELGKGL